MTTIEESKDPNTFPLDELVGSLLTHEMKIKNGKEPTKKVDMTFKSTTQEEEMVDEEKEMVMFSKRFNKFMKMDKNEIRRSQRRDMDKGKKKAMVATWSDSDYSDGASIDDEIANLYFMALEEQKVSSNSCDSIPYTFDKLQDAFEDLVLEFENMIMKYSKMISKLKIKNEILLKTKNELDSKNNELKLNFESSQKKIENLENKNLFLKEKCEGLTNEKIVLAKNVSCFKMTKCTHCNYNGHSLSTCLIRRKIPYKFRQLWVPKGTRDLVTNFQGPKAIWVPKSK